MLYSRPDIRTNQCTLNQPIHCVGFGLHGGNRISLSLLPAPANSGIFFLRRDVEITRALIPASWHNLFDTHPYTVIGNEYGVSISKVEHVLAALRGCGVDNALIEVSSGELPIFDGSSAPLVDMINQAGVMAQNTPRQAIWVERFVGVRSGEHYAYIKPGLVPHIIVDGVVNGKSRDPRQVSFNLLDRVFEHEIAPARNPQYCVEEALYYTTRNAKAGTIATEPRFEDETVRNRVLECLGFLALTDAPLYGQLYLYKPCSFLIDALLQELHMARDTWRQISYAEIDQLTGDTEIGPNPEAMDDCYAG
ncbi:MAG: UDP-3-O-acyl-N-acetylglucosamine deacetylase [Gammaproteobacteria bacterium]|nr:UDP-3-O-acyl-N-acetylglucosamine deacetylase [Gammaproteobacteria bacterium]MCP4874141.1 UDP-3-O-acyl-N-acetylglucosamine deacetylase [Gammaproteobacteria bacterium]